MCSLIPNRIQNDRAIIFRFLYPLNGICTVFNTRILRGERLKTTRCLRLKPSEVNISGLELFNKIACKEKLVCSYIEQDMTHFGQMIILV